MCAVFRIGARLTRGTGGKENRALKPLKQLILNPLIRVKILVTYPGMNCVRYKIFAFCKRLSSLGLSPWSPGVRYKRKSKPPAAASYFKARTSWGLSSPELNR
jgi:hypothetical protein